MSEPPIQPSYEQLAVENAQLKETLAAAMARIEALEARLGMTSKNSGKPPSSDGLAKPAPKSVRRKTGRGPGRPPGQPGTTLRQVQVPDHEVTHDPARCRGCGAGLADAAVVGVERRQVFDLPPVELEVTEHRLISRQCTCGTITKADAPAGVNAPVQYGPRLAGIGVYLFHGQFLSKSRTAQALADLFGVLVAAATVAAWTTRVAAQVTSKVLDVIRARISGSAVACFDETGLRVAGRLHWMHSASTSTDVLLTVHVRRGVKGMDAAGVLPGFTGVAVHDAWAPYDTYTDATHALCNAHALRELIYVVDTAPEPVAQLAQQAVDALVAVKDLAEQHHADPHADRHPDPHADPHADPHDDEVVAAVQTARAVAVDDPSSPTPQTATTNATQDAMQDVPADAPVQERLRRHQHLLRSAVVVGKTTTAARATPLERKYHALFTRLLGRWADYQRFTTDPAVPFDNNAAEQTVRMPKLRIKVSGCLRTLTGAEEFAAIRSYTATAARHGQNILDALVQAADHDPWIPTPAA